MDIRITNEVESMHYLVIDFEATCCNKNTFPRREMEIIEIGAVLCCPHTYKALEQFSSFVQPIRHRKLTSFCTELTTIQQQDVDSADKFPIAIQHFIAWIEKKVAIDTVIFCSWGDFDKHILRENCLLHNQKYPFFNSHINLKKRFQQRQKLTHRVGLLQAIQSKGLKLTGTHHRALDDALNTAKLLPFCL